MPSEEDIEFASQGATLRGVLLRPAPETAPAPRPLIVMAHGTSATIRMAAIDYARTFAAAGFAVLLYDHRNFGRSGGEPRGEINPWIQCRGYVDALAFGARLPGVDAARIGLWGDSYTGGQVVVVAACEPRVRCIVAQCPVFGAGVPGESPSRATFETIRATLRDGDVRGGPEHTTGPLPVVSFDPQSIPSLLQPIQAFRWFIDFGGRPGSGWVNRATRVIPPTPVPYSPYLCAPFVDRPALFMVAPDDEMAHANPEVARSAFEQVPGAKEWYAIRDGHFGLLYPGTERFEEATRVQTEFFRRHLAT